MNRREIRQQEIFKRRRRFPQTWADHQALITSSYDDSIMDFNERDFH